MESDSKSITHLLGAWQHGDQEAFETVTALVYDELRRLARAYMRRERPNHTLQPTALVNEAYLRLAGIEAKDWTSRAHFFAIAANIMRQLLVEHARTAAALKRGGGMAHVPLDEAMIVGDMGADLLVLDDALSALAKTDERKSRVLELRYFGGLEVAEIAKITSTSVATVGRDLRIGVAWLRVYMTPGKPCKDWSPVKKLPFP